MRHFLFILPILLAAPASAVEVTHSFEARFGVGYQADQLNPRGRFQSLYQGRFTSSFAHTSDSGMRFQFDLGIEGGNMTSPWPDSRSLRRVTVGFPRE